MNELLNEVKNAERHHKQYNTPTTSLYLRQCRRRLQAYIKLNKVDVPTYQSITGRDVIGKLRSVK